MKKVTLLLLGLFVAGLAAWAVPREQQAKPDIGIEKFYKTEVIAPAILVEEQGAPTEVAIVTQAEDPVSSNVEFDALTSRYRWQHQSWTYFIKQKTIYRLPVYTAPEPRIEPYPSIFARPNRW